MVYQLQFFAQNGQGGEKTEDATPKKLKDARDEGQVAKSMELIMAVSLTALFLMLSLLGGYIGKELMAVFPKYYGKMAEYTSGSEMFSVATALGIGQEMIYDIIWISLPLFLVAFAVAFIANTAQVKWKVTGKPLMPKFNKLDPIKGFKKIFGKDKIVELLKSILKIVVIAWVVYDATKDRWEDVMHLYDMQLIPAVVFILDVIVDLGLKISILFLLIGFGDLFYQRIKFKNDMKMTKQEVKDEYKQSEGDPQVKGKVRSRMREASRRRMMQELPKADVVITNPNHFAVAVRYDKELGEAPVVIAKGADYLAQKIKDIAKENKIEIVENKPLARMLYFNVEIGDEIPQELYQMVAEVLAYVYKVKNKALIR